jgi:sugar lactone lactonase YvrE
MLFTEGFPGWVRDAVSVGPGEWFVTTANGDVARWNPSEQTHEMLASGYDRLVGIDRAPSRGLVFTEMPTGRVLSIEGGNVSELAAGLDAPMGVAVAPDGTIFVSEAGAGRVASLSGSKAETVIDGLGRPEGIAISGGRLIIVDVKAKQLVSCDLSGGARQTLVENLPVGTPSGAVAKPLGPVGDMCGPMVSFTGIAASADGTLYVSGAAEGSVLAVSPA